MRLLMKTLSLEQLQELLDRIIPRIDPIGLDPEEHHCEHTLYLDRERIHKEFAAFIVSCHKSET
jgi:hypothetical protein